MSEYGSLTSVFCKQKERTWGEWYQESRTNRLFRHTLGRVSSVVRIPLYAIGALFMTLKTAVKIPMGVLGTALYHLSKAIITCTNGNPETNRLVKFFNAWSWEGMAKDALTTASLYHRALTSAVCVITAPPKEYHTLFESIGYVFKSCTGMQHCVGKQGNEHKRTATLKEHLGLTLAKMIPYQTLIIDDWGEKFSSEKRNLCSSLLNQVIFPTSLNNPKAL